MGRLLNGSSGTTVNWELLNVAVSLLGTRHVWGCHWSDDERCLGLTSHTFLVLKEDSRLDDKSRADYKRVICRRHIFPVVMSAIISLVSWSARKHVWGALVRTR